MNLITEERLQWIKRNAARVVEISDGLGDFPFGYDERSVSCLENYIVSMRSRGDFFLENCDALSDLYGCYLGEAMIVRHGGEWHEDDRVISVRYEGDFRFFPLTKVAKLIRNGLDDGESILTFYTGVPMYIEMLTNNKA